MTFFITVEDEETNITVVETTSALANTVVTVTEIGPIGPVAPLRLFPYVGGPPGPSEELFRFISPEAYTLDSSKCSGSSGNNATANVVFTLYNNNTSIVTFTFAAGTNTAVVSISNTTILQSDHLVFKAPLSVDATLQNIGFVIYGTINS